MTDKLKKYLDLLAKRHHLSRRKYEKLIKFRTKESMEYAAMLAMGERERIYSDTVFIRGLIEVSNYCKNDCLYCGIRRSNKACNRYRLTHDEIMECCREGYKLGFRTFVLQGGEDNHFTDTFLTDLIKCIKTEFPDCAVTLSLGERGYESFKALKDAGADRYLLRHETADSAHYSKLHPENLTLRSRKKALYHLKKLGYQVGCGFMVGSPYQSDKTISKDLKFIERFSPQMCGIGPFIPQTDTPFGKEKAGELDLTLYLLSIIRLIKPTLLIPATTALGSIDDNGREKGIKAGANVVMPNLSPKSVRKKYALYNNKVSDGTEGAEAIKELTRRMESIGFRVVVDRGDAK